ncbi:MAG: 30S ribosomal protein S16 [Desulfovibrionaceae bacterium]|nr:30S ribosomal protein S16 [Desulfovibrionaceae bacterium]
MSVKVRMTRMGSKKRAMFRIVAIDSASRRDGRPLEFLGFYNPHTDPAQVKINEEKLQAWLGKGAEMSDTVRSLLRRMKKDA